MRRNLHDKVIVITGASSGIGAATALACAEAGMHVVLAARREDRLRNVAAKVESLGRRALTITCDVTRDDDVQHLFDTAWQTFQRLDVVFANAGYGLCRSLMNTSDVEHRAIFETNYFGTIRCIHAAVPYLRQTHDGLKHLLICSSSVSEIGLPMYGPYSATKAAQDSIASALRGELARENIHVTSVHPVGTKTEFFDIAEQLGNSNNGDQESTPNTPDLMVQVPETVAKVVVKAIRKPRAEVWPLWPVRFGLAVTTAFPCLAARAMRKHAAKYQV